MFGDGGNDQMDGGDGRDFILGVLGNDVMSGGPGDDTIGNNFFEFGDDTLDSRDGVVNNDFLDGGPDTDTCNSDPDPEFSCELNRARSSNSSHATLSNYAYFAILGRFTLYYI